MKRFSGLLCLLLICCCHIAVGQSSTIEWRDTAVVNDDPFVPVKKPGDTIGSAKFHRTYGSEYGRLLKLANGNWLAAYTISGNTGYQHDPSGGFEIEVSVSSDDCRTWKKIAVITDGGRDLDNAQMIQLPDNTVILGGRSVRWQESYRLPVYESKDNGVTWRKLSTIDANEGKPGELGKPDKGIYEPHFFLLDDGRLSVMYANEKHVTDSVAYSQIISQKISADNGKSWGEEIWVAYAPEHHASRPGMPVWTKMKNGKYIVVYEICGPEKCHVYYKVSDDGVQWPVGFGKKIPGQLGGPYILSAADGTLIVSSNQSNISVSDDYGATWYIQRRAWDQSLWCSLFEIEPDEIAVMNSVRRPNGGHSMQIRFGDLKKYSQDVSSKLKNPVLDADFPDPTVINVNGGYYAYATESGGNIIQIATSADLQNWQMIGGALAEKPSWGDHHFWAPHVLYDSTLKKYVMFYSAESKDTSLGKCLGVAFADQPSGPFVDKGEPLICGEGFINIDPMAFVDRETGKKLLYWGSGFDPIKVQEMTDDWQHFKPGTTAKPVVMPGKEKNYTRLIEGAWIDFHNGFYYLYYSGDNCCGEKANYAVLVSRSRSPSGPFQSMGEANGSGSSVILEKDSLFLAPGHNSIVHGKRGKLWIAYHAIKANGGKAARVMLISPLVYENGWPKVVK